MLAFFTLVIFYLGAAVGSFLGVLIDRYNQKPYGKLRGKKIIFGSSQCSHCKKKLEGLDLVPIASYLALRGKCRTCEKKIGSEILWIEVATAILFAALFLKSPFIDFFDTAPYIVFSAKNLLQWINMSVISSFLMLIFFNDLKYQEIPDAFSVTGIIIAIISGIALQSPSLTNMIIGAVAALIFFQGQVIISRGKWLGEGDVRLGVLMGIFLGWKLLLIAIFTGYLLGALWGTWLLLRGKATGKTAIAFGPFLVTGTLLAIFVGDRILNWYTDFFLLS
jgi:prepilin signal peptidase PulO-like enzyme (type II secretory pathway)